MERCKIGDLVWAKMKGFSPWPGRVSEPILQLKKMPSKGMHCIYFFGSNNYAWIKESSIKPYFIFKEKLAKASKSRAFKEAVVAIEDYIENYKLNEQKDCNKIDPILNITEEMHGIPKNTDIKQETVYRFVGDICTVMQESDNSAIKIEENKVNGENNYDMKEKIELISNLKTEYDEHASMKHEDTVELKHENTNNCIDIEEHSFDWSVENRILPLPPRCNKNNNENASFSGKQRVKDEEKRKGKKKNIYLYNQQEVKFPCDKCKETFSSQNTLKRHVKVIHLDIMSYQNTKGNKWYHNSADAKHGGYDCNECSQRFYLKNHLKAHLNSKQIHKKHFNCDECKEEFLFHCSLIQHMSFRHKGIKNLQRKMISDDHLQKHTSICKVMKRHECDKCDQIFLKKSSLINHSRSHQGIKEFQCHNCRGWFHTRESLRLHLNSSHDKMYVCSECDHMFPTNGELTRHINCVHKLIKNYNCEICVKPFFRKSNLLIHINHHRGIKDFKCFQCGKLFSLKGNLKCHLNAVHKADDNYKCEVCGREFSFLSNLNRHINGVHRGVRKHTCKCGQRFFQLSDLKKHSKKHE